jgi:hypothetical protein
MLPVHRTSADIVMEPKLLPFKDEVTWLENTSPDLSFEPLMET